MTFWSLGVYDINVPTSSYEKQVSQLNNQISSIEDNENMVSNFALPQYQPLNCQSQQLSSALSSACDFKVIIANSVDPDQTASLRAV